MSDNNLLLIDSIPKNLLANLESRDVALWVRSLPANPSSLKSLVGFFGLPWRLIISETYDSELFGALEAETSLNDPLTRKRGFVQIIDNDPSRVELPQRCLPIYLLNGRKAASVSSDFESRLRRMTMLDALRRSGTREILVLADGTEPLPPDLSDLWSTGFRTFLTFVSTSSDAEDSLATWLRNTDGFATANLLRTSALQVIDDLLARYRETYPIELNIIRARDRQGILHTIDITEIDEPERPILSQYSLIEERDLTAIMPEELSEDDFVEFFRDPEASWRPYAAGLPWIRDAQFKNNLERLLKRLDDIGSDENYVAYIASESGAGGTTLARLLAWECARDGYPVFLAKSLPFVPEALPVVNFLNRAHGRIASQITQDLSSSDNPQKGRYDTPWIIVFDRLHWEYRDSELTRFRNEMKKSGRPVCLLVVTGTTLGLSFYNTSIFKELGALNHTLTHDDARNLGRHLNKYLRVYGKPRQEWQWDKFYEDHTVRYLEGLSSFWITLSFWIQGQYDISESIQSWMYRSFKDRITDRLIQEAILQIAALSSERLPLPEGLLPSSKGRWPTSQLLEDCRSDLSTLGLTRISTDGERYWALIHDILGRFLINALFYDFAARKELGFEDVQDVEHLRFLLLRGISQNPMLGERIYRSLGEDFSTTVFKIDPNHGRGNFLPLWKDVLHALDSMPHALRDTSRVFRHHTAISRRRIAKLDERIYSVSNEEKIDLLTKAIDDITYTLSFIDYTPGSESDLNLFNSLANAYLDLADAESVQGSPAERIVELRRLASDATRKAYDESPTNSFVIETYVKNLLGSVEDNPDLIIQRCIEALGVLFSALTSNEDTYRKSHLGTLADKALAMLLESKPRRQKTTKPDSAIGVLINAWVLLVEGEDFDVEIDLSELSEENRLRALDALSDPLGQGNMQVIRLTYDLTCITNPHGYKKQLEMVEQLQATDYRLTPQLRLEYAILLFQNGRAVEGDNVFRSLRRLWRESEQFVQVPDRLRWLCTADGEDLKNVHGVTGSDRENRPMMQVKEFGNSLVPFRPEEFDVRAPRPGIPFTCHVSFGHNGPFLRPVTAQPFRASRRNDASTN